MVLICSLIDFVSFDYVCLRSVESALFNSDLRDSVLMNSFVSGRIEFGRGVWLKNGEDRKKLCEMCEVSDAVSNVIRSESSRMEKLFFDETYKINQREKKRIRSLCLRRLQPERWDA